MTEHVHSIVSFGRLDRQGVSSAEWVKQKVVIKMAPVAV
jgi:hypothetical protein